MSARFGAGSDAIAAVVRRQQDLKVTLDRLDKRITAELGAPDGKRNEALIASLRAESARGQKSLEEATAQITRDFPGYVELASPSPLSIKQTQALLKPDEAVVSFLSIDSQSFVFAVTREGSAWQQISARQTSYSRSRHQTTRRPGRRCGGIRYRDLFRSIWKPRMSFIRR